ncbi:L-arabinose isomerase [Abditibacterium utsteinense]|uniref:L-arabinose isomerase n=1 Tax=Abditibacterium utsteinense TaxID=1960156 RepID=A0A2S8SRY9_9BACT|nr:L-arabinose isomerase [Abditibacterium utsteinense]PQV63548.1 L-arabinose isomerase [Abditibacterium utsteinense]
MIQLAPIEIWFVTGSQHLYGEATLQQVAAHSQIIAKGLDLAEGIPLEVVFKPIVTTPEEIRALCLEATNSPRCGGIITWMHTFSPAKMWIGGLQVLTKPLLHLHTQFNRDLPWNEIDMDFMNLNQAAHGDREFGFIGARMRIARKVVVGYWEDPEVQARIASWMRAARGWHDWQSAKFARFGDNMRMVAVTEGDKVAAEIKFGYSVNGYGIGDLVESMKTISDAQIEELVTQYAKFYDVAPELQKNGARHASLRAEARIELGLRTFLEAGNFKGFTDSFEVLHGLSQLPGLATQRLMAEGYGFGGEGDWKTCALVRAMKVMAHGLPGGTSFMEDYTYHLEAGNHQVLGSHMLEICPTIAAEKPSCQIHPLGIGGKDDPVRLVFDTPAGRAINASLIDVGNRFRLVVNEVDVVTPQAPLPNLPVARALWQPKPDFKVGCAAWIWAGGAHHTGFSLAIGREELEDFAEIAGIEFLLIGEGTTIRDFKQELRTNEVYYALSQGFGRV